MGTRPTGPYGRPDRAVLSGLHLALAKNRSTRQRGAIGAVIDIGGWPPIPQEMQKTVLTEVPTLSLATVYRNLQKLIAMAKSLPSATSATVRALS